MFIKNVELIVLDLDGTIADTAPDIRESLNLALCKWGLSPYPLAEVKRFIGNGVRVLAKRALEGRREELFAAGFPDGGNNPELLNRFISDHMFYYDTNDNTRTVLYEGVLEFLTDARIPLALLTNKPGVATMRFLDHFNIADCFAIVCHADNVMAHKPDPTGLQQIMQTLHISPAHTLMVGDGLPDIEVAKAAGTRSVALLQGNTGEAELRRVHPDWMVATFAEFTTLLSDG
jgi:phosphoglycolate phosphatase